MKLLLTLLFAASFALAQTTHKADLTWADTTNPAGATYSVYRAPGLCSGSPVFAKIASAIPMKTYSDTTVQPGPYCFAVTATVNGMESAQSNTAAAAVPSFAPTALQVVVQ